MDDSFDGKLVSMTCYVVYRIPFVWPTTESVTAYYGM